MGCRFEVLAILDGSLFKEARDLLKGLLQSVGVGE